MTENTGFSIKKEIPVTLVIPLFLAIGAISVLFYRVDQLEKNNINSTTIIERLAKMEVQQELILNLLKKGKE